MKLISWNVNGIRAIAKKGLTDFLKKEKPDFLCLQETKISEDKREKFSAQGGPASGWDFVGYQEFWHSAKRPGYSGVMILVKDGIKVKSEIKTINIKEFDDEGRILILETEKFHIANIYFPNAAEELKRLDYKLRFNEALFNFLKKLEKNKPIIICGDYNVAHKEIDIARPKDNMGNAGFTFEERNWMTQFLKNGFVDTFRLLNGDKIQYSWWSYRFHAREKNIGWRIDYFCVSKKIAPRIKKAFIMNDVYGSDHCPVGIEVSF